MAGYMVDTFEHRRHHEHRRHRRHHEHRRHRRHHEYRRHRRHHEHRRYHEHRRHHEHRRYHEHRRHHEQCILELYWNNAVQINSRALFKPQFRSIRLKKYSQYF